MPETPEIPAHYRRDRFDPVPELVRMARETPLVETDVTIGPSEQVGWVATGHAEVRAVLADAERFSTRPPADSEEDAESLVQAGNLLQYDPPDHTRLRKLLTPEYTVRKMRRLEPRIEEIVQDCLDTMERVGRPADLVRYFAWPIPGLASCELLGVPRDDQTELARYLDITRDVRLAARNSSWPPGRRTGRTWASSPSAAAATPATTCSAVSSANRARPSPTRNWRASARR
ncbi:hypothetical protein SRIMM317S_01654 [Streptomyces rimosus subsp. rimosus]